VRGCPITKPRSLPSGKFRPENKDNWTGEVFELFEDMAGRSTGEEEEEEQEEDCGCEKREKYEYLDQQHLPAGASGICRDWNLKDRPGLRICSTFPRCDIGAAGGPCPAMSGKGADWPSPLV
jgi:hypothetical protein